MVELPDNKKLGRLAGAMLADAAFVFAEASDSFAPEDKALLLARIALTCSERWELMVATETELAESLAANLLGIEEGAAEAKTSCADALAEWTNIFAGSLAVECVGGEPLRLGLPVVTAEARVKADVFFSKASRRANLVTEDGHHLAIGLRTLEAA